ncbi:MAG: DHH family phosphoesterase [SAR324 cluster bacterium]|nr:DHH family phosphoesterase [SAR324 cluster bacterium]
MPYNISKTKIDCSYPLTNWHGDKQCFINDILKSLVENRTAHGNVNFDSPVLKDIPDPTLLKDCAAAAELLVKFIQNKQKIVIYGDYDVDGISSAALLARFFEIIGFTNFAVMIPDRFTHGYGINEASRDDVLKLMPECLITVDNGSKIFAEEDFYINKKITLIITDHHQPDSQSAPSKSLFVNPKQSGCSYPDKDIAGVGVVYLLLIQLRRVLRDLGWWDSKDLAVPNLVNFLDLVTLGTIADQAPVIGLNRIFVYHGLKRINLWWQKEPQKQPFYLTRLQKHLQADTLTGEGIAFQIAPLINAAGRISHGKLAFDFLMSTNLDDSKIRFNHLAKLNQQRKVRQKDMLKSALESIKNDALNSPAIVYDDSFHEGLIGIIAGNLSQQLGVPAVVLSSAKNDQLKASCRSPAQVNLLTILNKLQHHFERFGGHSQAAAFQMKEEKLAIFKSDFCKLYEELVSEQNITSTITPLADLELFPWMATRELYDALEVLAPFGMQNLRPSFLFKGISLKSPSYTNNILTKWRLNRQTDLIIFGDYLPEFDAGLWDIMGSLLLKKNGRYTYLQIIINALAPAN